MGQSEGSDALPLSANSGTFKWTPSRSTMRKDFGSSFDMTWLRVMGPMICTPDSYFHSNPSRHHCCGKLIWSRSLSFIPSDRRPTLNSLHLWNRRPKWASYNRPRILTIFQPILKDTHMGISKATNSTPFAALLCSKKVLPFQLSFTRGVGDLPQTRQGVWLREPLFPWQ